MKPIAWPLIGHDVAEQKFLQAASSGKLHHAWLIEGVSGIGKSRFANRIAAYMLGAKLVDSNSLDVDRDDPIIKKIEAEAHPDLRWIKRSPDEKGKVKQDIPVDDVRSLNHFFSLRAALDGWRIGIIDSLDELNRNGSNAMLKTLEEPPQKCLLLLISHGTKEILPTIRSRCRMLRLSALEEHQTLDALKLADVEDPRSIAKLSRGRPGYGLSLSGQSGVLAANAARSWLRALPKPLDAATSQAIGTAGVDTISFEAFSSELLGWLSDRSTQHYECAKSWLAATLMSVSYTHLTLPTKA